MDLVIKCRLMMNKAKSFIFTKIGLSLVLASFILFSLGLVFLFFARTQNFAVRQHFSEVTARMLANTSPDESKIILRKFTETQSSIALLKMNTWILDEHGIVRFGNPNMAYPYSWTKTPKPTRPFKFEIYDEESSLLRSVGVTMIPGKAPLYLVVGKHYDHRGLLPAIITISVLILSIILISILITVLTFFYYFRRKNSEAKHIIQELKSGNLQARFKITTWDEVGLLMGRFNEMADQVEHVVKNLRTAENARIGLLKELTHDVQTPLTSLRTLTETLSSHYQQMEKVKREQCFDLVKAELTYLERLIRDLLTLAQLSDPKYQLSLEQVDIEEILKAEVASFVNQYPDIHVRLKESDFQTKIRGDTLLLRRLFKNALSNSFRYAHKTIKIDLIDCKDQIKVLIIDDGAGLSAGDINQYGKKKFSRILSQKDGGQICLGLGSVIMKEIAHLHQGDLTIMNNASASGAQVSISLAK